MPRSDNQRLKLLRILDFLLDQTDETHFVNNSQIRAHLAQFDIPADQRTIVSDIRTLEEYGLDVEYDARAKGYHVLSRKFDLYELQLLIDSVQTSKFITRKAADKIIQKLKSQTSQHERSLLDRRCYVVNRVRSMNESVFYHVDELHEAISHNRKISFCYFTYTTPKKKSYLRKGEAYIASPYALLWNDGNYYLLAYEGKKMKHFRVDKMDSIKVLDYERDGMEEFRQMKLSERSLKVFSMYGGTEEKVSLRFQNHLIGVVLDTFGKDIMIFPDDKEHFTIYVSVEASPQFYAWLCGLGKGVRIVSPAHVVEKYREHLQKVTEMYSAQ